MIKKKKLLISLISIGSVLTIATLATTLPLIFLNNEKNNISKNIEKVNSEFEKDKYKIKPSLKNYSFNNDSFNNYNSFSMKTYLTEKFKLDPKIFEGNTNITLINPNYTTEKNKLSNDSIIAFNSGSAIDLTNLNSFVGNSLEWTLKELTVENIGNDNENFKIVFYGKSKNNLSKEKTNDFVFSFGASDFSKKDNALQNIKTIFSKTDLDLYYPDSEDIISNFRIKLITNKEINEEYKIEENNPLIELIPNRDGFIMFFLGEKINIFLKNKINSRQVVDWSFSFNDEPEPGVSDSSWKTISYKTNLNPSQDPANINLAIEKIAKTTRDATAKQIIENKENIKNYFVLENPTNVSEEEILFSEKNFKYEIINVELPKEIDSEQKKVVLTIKVSALIDLSITKNYSLEVDVVSISEFNIKKILNDVNYKKINNYFNVSIKNPYNSLPLDEVASLINLGTTTSNNNNNLLDENINIRLKEILKMDFKPAASISNFTFEFDAEPGLFSLIESNKTMTIPIKITSNTDNSVFERAWFLLSKT